MDHLSIAERSENMRRIGAKNTKPELAVRSALHRRGFRYRIHDSRLPGKPDVYFPKYRMALFIHGCFWHQHDGCRRATVPKSNKKYWVSKLERNKSRFTEVCHLLNDQGIRTYVIWKCELAQIDSTIERFIQVLIYGSA